MMHGVLADLATLAPVGVFANIATLAPNPAAIQATPAPPESLATTLEPMVGVLADLATLAPNPATIQQATPAPPESLATTLEPMVGVLANLATLATNPATNQAPPSPPESLTTRLEPMIGGERSQAIPRKVHSRQDRQGCLTNEDGYVILSKSTSLTKLWYEWRYLLDPTQMLNRVCPAQLVDTSLDK
jgi:hypothetical protein